MFEFSPFRLDVARRVLSRGGVAVPLTAKSFDLLLLLVEHRDRVLTRAELMQRLWPQVAVEENNISVHVSTLRKALGESGSERRFIETLPRVGYRFVGAVTEPEAKVEPELAPAPPEAPQPGTGFVGREHELERLDWLLRRAQAGSGRMVFVSGESGIGKTALAERFVARAMSSTGSLLVARGRCVEQYGTPQAYLPILDAVGALLSGPAGDRVSSTLGRHAPSWCEHFPAIVDGIRESQSLESESRGANRERMLREMSDALVALSLALPTVLLLEDVHWADPSSVDLLGLICQRVEASRLLVLATLRSDELEPGNRPLRNSRREMLAHDRCEELPLPGLNEADIQRLLDKRFGPNDFPRELARSILHKTEGHALFVTRLLQFLDEGGDLVAGEHGFSLARPVAEMNLKAPDSLRGIISKKLESLDPEDRRALQYASVEGEEFSSTVLASVLEVDEIVLEERLQMLAEEQRLILPLAEDELCDGRLTTRYRFSHVLYQNVLYGGLVSKRRAQLHLRVAETYIRQVRGQTSGIAAKLALHFERARDYARAIVHLLDAGENASRLRASEEAKIYYSRALELAGKLPPGDPARAEPSLYEKRGWVHFHAGELGLALHDFESMLALARALGNITQQCAALQGSCRTLLNSHRVDELEARAQEALELAVAAGSEKLRIEAQVSRAQDKVVRGDLALAACILAETIDTARRLDHPQVLRSSLVWRGMLHFFQSEYEDAAARCLEAEGLARASGSFDQELLALYFRALSHANLGRIGESIAALGEAERLARQNCDLQMFPKIPNALGWIYRELGDLERAIEQNAKSRQLAQTHDLLEAETHSVLNLALDYLGRRDEAPAQSALVDAEALIARSPFLRWRFLLRAVAVRGEHLLELGGLEGAERCGADLLQHATEKQVPKYRIMAHMLLAQVASARGELDAAQVALERAADILRRHPMPLLGWKLHALRAGAQLRTGNSRAAERAWAESSEIIHQIAASILEPALRSTFLRTAAAQQARASIAEPVPAGPLAIEQRLVEHAEVPDDG